MSFVSTRSAGMPTQTISRPFTVMLRQNSSPDIQTTYSGSVKRTQNLRRHALYSLRQILVTASPLHRTRLARCGPQIDLSKKLRGALVTRFAKKKIFESGFLSERSVGFSKMLSLLKHKNPSKSALFAKE